MIKLSKINKIIGQEHILKDIDLDIYEGEFVSIIGPSGSGKSSLLYIIGLLDTPTSGSIYIDGNLIDFKNQREIARLRNTKMGFVFQFHYLINELTALENVIVPLIKARVEIGKSKVIARELLKKVGLEGKEDRKPYQLSGGQQQRVAIARALSNNPQVIIADEPTGNLDSKNTQIVMDIFKQLNTEGKTIIMVTHELELANQTNRIISMKDGRIVS
ncbi:MAG: ABC transporter ATP-binding protein [Hydrogenothermaceae bacterium]|nr:ABC transporter ATP-binding protein [Hydrogenothermaceae bacterium]